MEGIIGEWGTGERSLPKVSGKVSKQVILTELYSEGQVRITQVKKEGRMFQEEERKISKLCSRIVCVWNCLHLVLLKSKRQGAK